MNFLSIMKNPQTKFTNNQQSAWENFKLTKTRKNNLVKKIIGIHHQILKLK